MPHTQVEGFPSSEGSIKGIETMHEESLETLGELTPGEKIIEKRIVRRIDFLVMPIVIVVYLMNYIDRNNYASARLQGLEEDLHMVGDQYQIGLSVMYISYILAQVPSNLLLNITGRPSLHLGFFVISWGLVAALTSQVTNFGGMVACRFLIGAVEAPFFAGVLFYLSKWYKRSELNLRMSIFYSGSLVSGAFGNLIAAGILNGLSGARGLTAWQWLYIIEGSITIFFGFVVLLFLPDFPHTWRLLSDQEKYVAIRRMALDSAGEDTDAAGVSSQLAGLKLAFLDVKTWILTFAYMAITAAVGFQNFLPTLTATLGYSRVISLLLVAPPYIFMAFWSNIHGYLSDRFQTRFWFFIYPIPISIAGYAVFMTVDSFGPKYFSIFLAVFVFAMNGTLFSWIASSIPRPPAKRAAAIGIINGLGNSASIWTPFTFIENEAPYYRTAFGIAIACQVIALLLSIVLSWILRRENKRLEMLENYETPLSPVEFERLQQLADAEGVSVETARNMQRGFRYII